MNSLATEEGRERRRRVLAERDQARAGYLSALRARVAEQAPKPERDHQAPPKGRRRRHGKLQLLTRREAPQ